MPRLNSEIKEQIKGLSRKVLEEIVMKIAAKEQSVLDFIVLNYLDKETGENELYEKAKNDLNIIFRKRYVGRVEQIQLTNMLAAAVKRVNEFTKVSKNKVLEANLLLYVLNVPFSLNLNIFGTCFTSYDSKVAQILKRLITLVTTKLHPDYFADYQDIINDYLQTIRRKADFLDSVYHLPKSI
jgi:hypothetical protein